MRHEPTGWLVCYDICHPKRLRRVYTTMRGYGEHLQYSVFHCVLSPVQLACLHAELEDIIAPTEDQVLLVPLGRRSLHHRGGMRTLGRPLAPLDRAAKVF